MPEPTTPPAARNDVLALWCGIGACVLVTLAIWILGDRLKGIEFLPDEGYSWYFWKLPEKTTIAWWSAWGLYTAHQLAHFALIYYAQKHVRTYTTGLHPVNVWALVLNATFVLLHFAQTHLWFDGLAQDHPPQYPQYAVILMLVWVLLMENRRRGLILGKKVPVGKQVASFALKYHGYVFSWAILYTFWYHPMYSSPSHLSGFFYTLLFMLQGSLFFTRVHANRYWTFVQEFSVLVHGTIVAFSQGPNMWPMFFFGFAGLLVFTQMHGIGLSRTSRWAIAAVYLASIVWVYQERGIGRLEEVARIPVVEYLLVGILGLLFGLGILFFNLASGRVRWGKAKDRTSSDSGDRRVDGS
ncbi:MAG: hypothetical protein AAF517_06450 [Planctomycetota bacterium]